MDLNEKYYEMFGEAFPMYQIGRTISDEQIAKIIQRCLDEKKDAYELGYCTDDLDVKY